MTRISLFLDSSALFSGIASSQGAARALLLLGETDQISLIISEQVVTETERAVARKLPGVINEFRRAVLSSKARIVSDPSGDEVQSNLDLIADPTDVPILLAAMRSHADFLVTLNRRHFLEDPAVAERAGLPIGTPGDALSWVKSQLPGSQ